MNGNNVMCSDSFGVEPIPKEITKLKGNQNIIKIFIEYKLTIRQCVDTFVLDLLILCSKVKVC